MVNLVQKRTGRPTGKIEGCKHYNIDLKNVMAHNLVDSSHMLHFLKSHIKVDGVVNNLRKAILVESDPTNAESIKITVNNEKLSKRCIKFQCKKYFRKISLDNYVRILSPTREGIVIKMFTPDN